jgi:predicted phage terminase large subunit-like protein
MINKTTEALSLSFNLGSNIGGRRRFIGTFYHYADTYSVLIARGAAKPRIYAATDDGTVKGTPWIWTRETLEDKVRDMGSYVSSCQIFCKPVQEGEEVFNDTWLRYWIPDMRNLDKMNKYILVDPANEKKEASDYTVIMVIGLGSDRNYYLIDMVRDRLDLRERTARLFKLHAEYRPLVVGYEKYGIQADIQHIESEMANKNYRFRVIPLAGNTKKNDRIKRLQPIFQQGRFYIPEKLMRVDTKGTQHDLVAEFLQDEYRQFPFMSHDDMLDCMCRICDADLETFFPQVQADDQPSWVDAKNDSVYDYDTLQYLEQ